MCRIKTTFCVAIVAVPSLFATQVLAQEKEVRIRAAMLAADLKVQPVPQLELLAIGTRGDTTRLATNLDGELRATLPVGEYRIESVAPLDYAGSSYRWIVPLVVGSDGGYLELTQRNAQTGTAVRTASVGRRVSEEAAVFERTRGGVFTIEGEAAHGSGFLFDRQGLVLTNAHVIGDTRDIRVRLSRERTVRGRVLHADRENDVAVVAIHPSACGNCPVLPFAADAETPVAVEGERVLAIGSPLNQTGILTTGIVSKVEPRAIISDVNINHGNSGGPLLNLAGEVIGINTFGDFSRAGPGIAGSIRLSQAARAIAAARDSFTASAGSMPSADRLPFLSSVPFPMASLRAAAMQTRLDTRPYAYVIGPFDVSIMTPRISAWRQARADEALLRNRRQREARAGGADRVDPVQNWPAWAEYVGERQPGIIVHAMPRAGANGASLFLNLLAAASSSAYNPNVRMEFKGDFQWMRLLRDGEEVEPVSTGRVPAQLDIQAYNAHGQDFAKQGIHIYRPEDFAPRPDGAFPRFELEVQSLGQRRAVKIAITPQTVEALWRDFEPHRAELLAGADDAPVGVLLQTARGLIAQGLPRDAESYLQRANNRVPGLPEVLGLLVTSQHTIASQRFREARNANVTGQRAVYEQARQEAQSIYAALLPHARQWVDADPANTQAYEVLEDVLDFLDRKDELSELRESRDRLEFSLSKLLVDRTSGVALFRGEITNLRRESGSTLDVRLTWLDEFGESVGTAVQPIELGGRREKTQFTAAVPATAVTFRYAVPVPGS